MLIIAITFLFYLFNFILILALFLHFCNVPTQTPQKSRVRIHGLAPLRYLVKKLVEILRTYGFTPFHETHLRQTKFRRNLTYAKKFGVNYA